MHHAFVVCAALEGFIKMVIACFRFPRAAEWLAVNISTNKSIPLWDNGLVSCCARSPCHSVRLSTSLPPIIASSGSRPFVGFVTHAIF